jgi:eukaryotic-like serine/threonine-protein kinase
MIRLSTEAYEQFLDTLLDADANEAAAQLAQLAQTHPDDAQALAEDLAKIQRSQGYLEATQSVDDYLDANEPLLTSGALIGAWRVLGLIGSGGMGMVFKVERATAEFRQVGALKLLSHLQSTSIARFERERQLLAELNHRAIVRLLDGGSALIAKRMQPYLVTELIEGSDLHIYVKTHRPGLSARLEIFEQVAEAISYAHNQLVVHRDIKPSNIRMDVQGRAHVLDFGISRTLHAADDAYQTRTLTLNFGAPEQLTGGRISVQTDVYALGALLFWLLTDRPPQQLEHLPMGEALKHALEAPVPSLARMQPAAGLRTNALHADLDAICQQALAKAPQDRYGSAFAMLEDLRAYRESRPIRARKLNFVEQSWRALKRNWRGVAAASLVFISLCSALIISRAQTARVEQARLEAVEARNYAIEQGQANSLYKDLMLEVMQTNSGTALTPEAVLARLQVRLQNDSTIEQKRLVTSVLAELYAEQKNWLAVNTLLEGVLPQLENTSADDGLLNLRCLHAASLTQMDQYERALALLNNLPHELDAPDKNSPLNNLMCLSAYAYAHGAKGNLAEVKRILTPGIAACEQQQNCDPDLLSGIYMSLGSAALDSRDYALAQTAFANSGKYLRKAGRQESSDYATWLNNSANTKSAIGLIGDAKSLMAQAIALRRRLSGDSAGLAKLLINQASQSCSRAEPTEAMQSLQEAERLIDRFAKGELALLSRLYLHRACANAQRFEFDQAQHQMQASEVAFGKLPQANWTEWHQTWHEIYLLQALQAPSTVKNSAWQAHLEAVNTEANRKRPRQYLNVAEYAWLQGRWQAALEAATTALTLYQKVSDPGSYRLAEATLVQWAAQKCLGQAPDPEIFKRAREQLAKQVSSAHWMLRSDILFALANEQTGNLFALANAQTGNLSRCTPVLSAENSLP